jgi:hypothetical protein
MRRTRFCVDQAHQGSIVMTENNNRQGEQPASDLSAMMDQRITDPAGAPGPDDAQAGDLTAAGPAPDASSVERAEQIADRLAEKCAGVASACVRKLAWLTARAREAAEDLWAEAQSIRNKE